MSISASHFTSHFDVPQRTRSGGAMPQKTGQNWKWEADFTKSVKRPRISAVFQASGAPVDLPNPETRQKFLASFRRTAKPAKARFSGHPIPIRPGKAPNIPPNWEVGNIWRGTFGPDFGSRSHDPCLSYAGAPAICVHEMFYSSRHPLARFAASAQVEDQPGIARAFASEASRRNVIFSQEFFDRAQNHRLQSPPPVRLALGKSVGLFLSHDVFPTCLGKFLSLWMKHDR
ncbi:hypothetical protein SAMN02927924_01330 [Sphingobium faniae]|nr:hypothetical protein SAMN02927924_01330 [Sphingobium faniae]